MWKCPRCNREFKNKNQDHFCDDTPKSIDEYIERQPKEYRERLYILKAAIKEAIPNAKEKISWSMPTFWEEHNIIHFASFKKHIGLYPGPDAVTHFKDKIKDFKSSKGAIQFQYDKPLPINLIKEITKWCYEKGNHH